MWVRGGVRVSNRVYLYVFSLWNGVHENSLGSQLTCGLADKIVCGVVRQQDALRRRLKTASLSRVNYVYTDVIFPVAKLALIWRRRTSCTPLQRLAGLLVVRRDGLVVYLRLFRVFAVARTLMHCRGAPTTPRTSYLGRLGASRRLDAGFMVIGGGRRERPRRSRRQQ